MRCVACRAEKNHPKASVGDAIVLGMILADMEKLPGRVDGKRFRVCEKHFKLATLVCIPELAEPVKP